MAIDVAKEIRRAVDSGTVKFGVKETEKSLLKDKAQLIVISSNAPKKIKEKIENYCKTSGIPVYNFEGNGLELGAVCGKPFTVSTMTVKDAGKSKILSALKEKTRARTRR